MTTAIVSTTSPSAENPDTKPINRREFLNYFLGASAGVLLVEACGAAAWFALPRSHVSVPSNIFKIDAAMIPLPELAPIFWGLRQGPVWLVNTKQGLLVLSEFCTHNADWLVKWVIVDDRFECPACGSQFRLDGTYISGPAPRNMNRFVIHITTPHSTVSTPPDGSPISIQDATAIVIDETKKILGKPIVYAN